MEFGEELTYLTEIHTVAGILTTHGEQLLEARDRWVASNADITSRLQQRPVPGPVASRLPDLTNAQRDLWLALESFLAAWSRASLLLFPVRGSSRKRGEYLRGVLKIEDSHPFADRDLRNDWMHFDERLDDAFSTYGRLTAQRFDPEPGVSPNPALREIAMDPFSVAFLGKAPVRLEPLIEAAKELMDKVGAASETLGDRNPPAMNEGN